MRKQSGPEVFRITGARAGLTEDVRARQRRYVISMSIRTVSVILAVVLWNIERPLAWAMLVLGAVLPYVAVVFANGGRENGSTEMPTITVPPPGRRALEATTVEQAAERDAHHAHPADGASPTGSAQPSDGAHRGDDAPATDGARPADAASPTDGTRPADATSPTDGTRPADDGHPADDAHTADGTRPADDGHPADGSTESARTGGIADPGATRSPASDAAERPAAETEPVTDRSDAR